MRYFFSFLAILLFSSFSFADFVAEMNFAVKEGKGAPVGAVTLEDTSYGLLLTPELSGLEPGVHAFHIHNSPNCGNEGRDAGEHFDPDGTERHMGPYSSEGHKGDLPILYVDQDGMANVPVLAPKLTEADVRGRALIVHAYGDAYATKIKPFSGSGPIVACGVIMWTVAQ